MPKVALADTLQDWEGLLAAATEQGAGDPVLAPHLAKLREALERTRDLDHLRRRLQAERQKATQDLNATRRTGEDLAMGLRGLLVATFGPRWAGLVQFGVRPIPARRRSRTSRQSTEPSTPLDE